MRILFFAFLLISVPCLVNAQDQQEIKNGVNNYADAMKKNDWNYVLDHTYPGVFELVPRNQMERIYQAMSNEFMEAKIANFEVLEISDTYNYGTDKYAKVTYNVEMQMLLKGDMWNDQFTTQTMTSLQQQFGEATYDEMTRTMYFKGEKEIYAIQNSKSNGRWTFLETDKRQTQMLEQLIPGEVIQYFNR